MSMLSLEKIRDFLAKLAEESESVYWLSSPDFKQIAYISPAYEKIWGRPRDTLYTNPESWITYLHPDDVHTYHPIHAMAERINQQGADARYEETYRIVRPDGEIRWIVDRGFPIYDDADICCGVTGVAIDITKEKQVEEALRIAKEKAEIANKAKSEFIAVASHELRTPLTGIIGMTQFLTKESLPESERKIYTEHLQSSAKYLLTLINDLLDFAKLEANQLELTPAPFDLKKLTEEIVQMLTATAKSKQIDLLLEYAPTTPYQVIGDSRALQQILINLVGNSIKFTSKGFVRIEVKCLEQTTQQATFALAIEDTGPGIPADKLDTVFERFHQLDSPYTRATSRSGTGLGLSISKKLVGLMNGKITLQSELEKGSIFTCIVTFPLQVNIINVNNKKFQLTSNNPLAKTKYKVLLVEDDIIVQIVHQKYLANFNCEVTIATSGIEAIELAKQGFDLILMDIGLPKLNGFEATQQIRQQEKEKKKKHTRIIGITGFGDNEAKERCITAGMNEVIVKPLTLQDIEKLLS